MDFGDIFQTPVYSGHLLQPPIYRTRNYTVNRQTPFKQLALPFESQIYFGTDATGDEHIAVLNFAPPDPYHIAAVQQPLANDKSIAVNHGFTVPVAYQNVDQSKFEVADRLSGVQCSKDDIPGGEQAKAAEYIRGSMINSSRVEDKITPKAIRDNGVLNGDIPVEHFHHAAKDVVEAAYLLHMYGRQERGFSDPTVEKDGTIDSKERNLTFVERMKAISELFKCSKRAVYDAIKQDLELEYTCVMALNTTLKLKRACARSNDERPRMKPSTKEQSEATEQPMEQDDAEVVAESNLPVTKKRHRTFK